MPTVATVDILVKPRSKHDRISRTDDGRIAVSVTAPPQEGRANARVVKLVAKRLRVPQSAVRIVRGMSSKHKTMRIEGKSTAQIIAGLQL